MNTTLPKTYPGCWRNGGFMRRYKAAWQRIQREDSFFRQRELARQKVYRETPRGRKKNADAGRRWRKAHPCLVKKENQRWHLRNRVRRCHFCGKRGKSGRGALQRIARMLPAPGGALVRRVVDYCGSC